MTGAGRHMARNLGRDPGYGLHRKKRKYHLDGQPPAGPRLVRFRGLLRRPYSERVNRQRLRRARFLLLGTGLAVLLIGLLSLPSSTDGTAVGACAAGAAFVVLGGLAWLRPAPALWVGVLLFALLAPFAVVAIGTYGPDNPGLWVIQSPVTMAAIMAMLVVLISLIAGARAAGALARVSASRE